MSFQVQFCWSQRLPENTYTMKNGIYRLFSQGTGCHETCLRSK